jgi:hypothetical protein
MILYFVFSSKKIKSQSLFEIEFEKRKHQEFQEFQEMAVVQLLPKYSLEHCKGFKT